MFASLRLSGMVFPACAGVIPNVSASKFDGSRFPRMRGGDPRYTLKRVDSFEFSPHARG